MRVIKKTEFTVSCCGEEKTILREKYPDRKSIDFRCPKCKNTQTVIFDETVFEVLPEPDRSICLAYFHKKKSLADISKDIGRGRSYVRRHIERTGFRLRSISLGKKLEYKKRKK